MVWLRDECFVASEGSRFNPRTKKRKETKKKKVSLLLMPHKNTTTVCHPKVVSRKPEGKMLSTVTETL